jgi:protein TonB
MTAGQPEPSRTELAGWLGVSLLLHLALFGAVMSLARLAPPMIVQRRGEPLFVELPNLDRPAPRGNPAERSKEAVRPRRAAASTQASRGVPPAPAAREAPRSAPPAIKEMPAQEPRVASLPKPEAAPTPPPPAVRERAEPLPRPESRPPRPEVAARPAAPESPSDEPRPEERLAKPQAPPVPAAPKERPELVAPPPPRPAPDTRVAKPEAPVPPATREAPNLAQAPEPRVAALPKPEPPASAPSAGAPASAPTGDRLAALRPHAPGGGLRDGRGGIEGEPIPLDSKDPKYTDYLEKLRRAIKDKWAYPREAAEQNIGGQLVLEFGIAKDGHLRFIELRRSSGVPVLDDYAMNAVKLASPFPPVPDQMSRAGIPVMAVFNYIIDVDRSRGALYNFLR